MKNLRAYAKKRTSVRRVSTSQATTGETIVLTMFVSVAFTCVAIGFWSLLAFFNGLNSYGTAGIISGFFRAVTGQ